MKKLDVVAAIPHYKMPHELGELLPQIVEQPYAGIYVLDDASPDIDYVRDVIAPYEDEVKLVVGKTNEGAGPNRNRVSEVLGDRNVLIHFLDADISLETAEAPQVIRDIVPREGVGCLGGLALTPAGFQNVWNYGPRPGLRGYLGGKVQSRIESLLTENPIEANRLRRKHALFLEGRPDPLAEPIRREVYWVVEQCMVIPSVVLKQTGGFDRRFRETEILELSIRMHKLGLRTYFDPALRIQHKETQVRDYDRAVLQRKEKRDIARLHGRLNWLLSTDRF